MQRVFVEKIRQAPRPYIVVATGPAGCGKTLLAASVGCEKLMRGEVERLVITRPAVGANEDHGFLPGKLDEKMMPWMRPVLDALSRSFTEAHIKNLRATGRLELAPLQFMRGRTFDNAYILCDEAQNCTPNQLLMVMTRIGSNSKMVVTGDPDQYDRTGDINALSDFVHRYHHRPIDSSFVELVEFNASDVRRHPVIPSLLHMYRDDT